MIIVLRTDFNKMFQSDKIYFRLLIKFYYEEVSLKIKIKIEITKFLSAACKILIIEEWILNEWYGKVVSSL